MNITVDRAELVDALSVASSVVPKNSPKPILTNALLSMEGGQCKIVATYLEIGVTIGLSKTRDNDGAGGRILLPVSRVASAMRYCSDDTVVIATEGKKLVVRGSNFVDRSNTDDPKDFPFVPTMNHSDAHGIVNGRILAELIHRTEIATEKESTRWALGGIKLEVSKSLLTGIATDGRRFAVQEGPIEKVGRMMSKDAMVIVPSRAASLIRRVASGCESVKIQADANGIIVEAGNVAIYSSLLSGRFPEWRQIIPSAQRIFDVPAGVLLVAVKQTMLSTLETHRVDFTVTNEKLELSSGDTEIGRSESSIAISSDMSCSFSLNGRYVADALNVLDGDAIVTVSYKDEKSPVMFETADSYRYGVMPLATEREPK